MKHDINAPAAPRVGTYKAHNKTLYLVEVELSDSGLWSAFTFNPDNGVIGELFCDDWLKYSETEQLELLEELPDGLLEEFKTVKGSTPVIQIF